MRSDVRMKNIFLDFLGPDIWKTLPSFVGPDREKIRTLSRSLNIAVLLTEEYCILPPAFVAQSYLVRRVLQDKEDFLKNRMVVFPLRESRLEYYFEKKCAEYNYVKDSHQEFYSKRSQKFIRDHADAIIHRTSPMGLTIAEHWRVIPDNSEQWKPVINADPTIADQLREIPGILKDRGISVTLEAVKKEAGVRTHYLDFAINQAIQHEYLETYLKEYGAAIIEDIPPKALHLNYLIKGQGLYYNYYNFTRVLDIFGMDEYLKSLPASAICRIKRSKEFMDFMDLYANACLRYDASRQVEKYFLRLKKAVLSARAKLPVLCYVPGFISRDAKVLNLLEVIMDKSCAVPLELEEDSQQKVGAKSVHHVRKERRKMDEKVFLVHGRNKDVRDDVELFLRKIGLTPIILAEQANAGMTITEKLEHYSDVIFAVVLYTPCDEGRRKNGGSLQDRARQNVVFEHGYLVGKLGRDKVAALVEPGVEIPGDLSGMVYISLQEQDWKQQLMKELLHAGLKVSWEQA